MLRRGRAKELQGPWSCRTVQHPYVSSLPVITNQLLFILIFSHYGSFFFCVKFSPLSPDLWFLWVFQSPCGQGSLGVWVSTDTRNQCELCSLIVRWLFLFKRKYLQVLSRTSTIQLQTYVNIQFHWLVFKWQGTGWNLMVITFLLSKIISNCPFLLAASKSKSLTRFGSLTSPRWILWSKFTKIDVHVIWSAFIVLSATMYSDAVCLFHWYFSLPIQVLWCIVYDIQVPSVSVWVQWCTCLICTA